jgi:hypothetical protein
LEKSSRGEVRVCYVNPKRRYEEEIALECSWRDYSYDMLEDVIICDMQETIEENIVLEELSICLLEVVALIMKQEEVALGFQPYRRYVEEN